MSMDLTKNPEKQFEFGLSLACFNSSSFVNDFMTGMAAAIDRHDGRPACPSHRLAGAEHSYSTAR